MTINVRTVDESIPPIIGTAMRCITSEPVPVLHYCRSALLVPDGDGAGTASITKPLPPSQRVAFLRLGIREAILLRSPQWNGECRRD
jgi:hypothetical protein